MTHWQHHPIPQAAPWFNRSLHRFNSRFIKHPADTFIMSCIYVQGICIPCLFLLAFWYTTKHGFSPLMCFLYHIIRIGPYFQQFAYYYVLCHKEGHTRTGFYMEPYNSFAIFRHVFNWWIALFFGVMPAAFAFGHSYNHHRYNNGPLDVVSTGDKPRDSFVNLVAYLPRWTLYSLNITSIAQFVREGSTLVALRMLAGCVYWWGWYTLWASQDLAFAMGFVLYPFGENVLLLAAVNWAWHAFEDPDNPANEYVGSITIFGGRFNVLNEDSHVVHHQYPGAHWTEHPTKVTHHWDEYVANRASCFQDTHAFELFVLCMTANYGALADKYVDLHGARSGKPLTRGEKVELLIARLQACSWGPRATARERSCAETESKKKN